jgi:hypothetical protein
MPPVKDITGQKFGRLFVIEISDKKVNRNTYWKCKCDCGNVTHVLSANLAKGITKSCGCYQRDRARAAGDRTRTHGMTKTTTYNVWSSMMQRCENTNAKDYYRYGAVGIRVSPEWHSFENFLADMGVRPKGKSIDRIDNKKGYFAENCRWADAKTQQRNKNNNRLITSEGLTLTIAEWAERKGINRITLGDRLNKGWSEHDAINRPIEKRYSHQKNRKA